MSNYVAEYRRHEDNAARDETQAEQYRQRADENRWEQCRIAHEATVARETKQHTQAEFAKAVGKSETTIFRQAGAWKRHGHLDQVARPSYGDAIAEVGGLSTLAERRSDLTMGRARNLPAEDKLDLHRQLMDDPEVGDKVVEQAEDEGIRRRAARAAARPPGPGPDEVAERVRRNMGRALGRDTDQATDYLSGAASDIAHAVVAKEQYGIDYPDAEAEALAKIDHWLSVYRSEATVTSDDRGWLDTIGVEL